MYTLCLYVSISIYNPIYTLDLLTFTRFKLQLAKNLSEKLLLTKRLDIHLKK